MIQLYGTIDHVVLTDFLSPRFPFIRHHGSLFLVLLKEIFMKYIIMKPTHTSVVYSYI